MSKTQQSQDDLKKHLDEQLHFLRASADSYDAGYEAEAKRLAVIIRVLLHDTAKSTSLLAQLGVKDNLDFYDSGIVKGPGTVIGGGASLVVIPGGGGNAIPFFDDSPPGTSGYVKFTEYWNRPVLETREKHFTRKELVSSVANTDGGAHVDPELDEEYANLSRNDAFGWKAGTSETGMSPVGIVELASIRQIAHEILRTLIPDYPQKMLPRTGLGLMFPRIIVTMVEPEDKKKDQADQSEEG